MQQAGREVDKGQRADKDRIADGAHPAQRFHGGAHLSLPAHEG